MKKGKSNLGIWTGLSLILLNFIVWIFTRGSNPEYAMQYGLQRYYLELVLWLVLLNLPAIIILLFGIFSKGKENTPVDQTKSNNQKQENKISKENN